MSRSERSKVEVCVGFPGLQQESCLASLRELDPRIELSVLPVDPDGDWLSPSLSQAHEEPPPWARSVADERAAALARAEVLVGLHAPRDLMRHASRVRWVHCVASGVEGWADSGASSDRLVVTNSAGIGARSIAEFVMARLLQFWKRLPLIDAAQRERRWAPAYGRTFFGTTMGLIGLGAIGREVARRARAFGAEVLAIKRSWAPGMTSEFADELFGPGDLHEVLGRCDSVVVAAPLTPETEGMIDAAALSAMKPGTVLVNVARGGLIHSDALIETMRAGHLGAAILDVFDEEPLAQASPFWDLPHTWVSPHAAVAVDRYIEDLLELFRENLRRYLDGEDLRNVVDMAAHGFASGR